MASPWKQAYDIMFDTVFLQRRLSIPNVFILSYRSILSCLKSFHLIVEYFQSLSLPKHCIKFAGQFNFINFISIDILYLSVCCFVYIYMYIIMFYFVCFLMFDLGSYCKSVYDCIGYPAK